MEITSLSKVIAFLKCQLQYLKGNYSLSKVIQHLLLLTRRFSFVSDMLHFQELFFALNVKIFDYNLFCFKILVTYFWSCLLSRIFFGLKSHLFQLKLKLIVPLNFHGMFKKANLSQKILNNLQNIDYASTRLSANHSLTKFTKQCPSICRRVPNQRLNLLAKESNVHLLYKLSLIILKAPFDLYAVCNSYHGNDRDAPSQSSLDEEKLR